MRRKEDRSVRSVGATGERKRQIEGRRQQGPPLGRHGPDTLPARAAEGSGDGRERRESRTGGGRDKREEGSRDREQKTSSGLMESHVP